MKKILIIDDDEDIRIFLSFNLKKEGFEVETAKDGIEGLEKYKIFLPTIVLLDVMMPGMDGIEVCENIRSLQIHQSIICFLSARNEDFSQIAGLEAGADDYIFKPIKPKVLISKINSLIRRVNPTTIPEKGKQGITINRSKYIVEKDGKEIQLPKKEFELLALLASKPSQVFERDHILEKVWGTDIVVGDRTIDVHIRKLREKLGDHYIKTIKGIGYKFEE